MKTLLLICSLLVINCAVAQSTQLEGQIVDEASKDPIVYANIGVIGGNVGTVSDFDGTFSLLIPDSLYNGKMRVSIYGYDAIVVEVADLLERSKGTGPLVISLIAQIQELAEVEVNSRKLKRKIIGKQADSGTMTLGFSSDELGTEMGVFVNVKRKSFVENFNFYVHNSDYDSLTFRINFYGCDEKGNPVESLLVESIIFKLDSISTGPVKIDLKEYYLILNEDTYLSLEVVKGFPTTNKLTRKKDDRNRAGLTFGARFGGNASFRFTSQSAWENIPLVAPGLYLTVRQ